jgi:hypothetical protein
MTTQARRPGAEVMRLIPVTSDPPADSLAVLIYPRQVNGVLRVLARFSNGQVVIIV